MDANEMKETVNNGSEIIVSVCRSNNDLRLNEKCLWPPSLIQIHDALAPLLTSKMGRFETRGYGIPKRAV